VLCSPETPGQLAELLAAVSRPRLSSLEQEAMIDQFAAARAS
jgi:hypothetical protein